MNQIIDGQRTQVHSGKPLLVWENIKTYKDLEDPTGTYTITATGGSAKNPKFRVNVSILTGRTTVSSVGAGQGYSIEMFITTSSGNYGGSTDATLTAGYIVVEGMTSCIKEEHSLA